MTVVGPTRARRLGGRINLKNNTRDFLPISIGFFGIEQTHIGDRVLLVVRCQRWLVWRCVCHFGIERRHYRKLLSALEASTSQMLGTIFSRASVNGLQVCGQQTLINSSKPRRFTPKAMVKYSP